MKTDTPIRVVSLVVVSDPASRILLVRSAKRAQRWELPGGQVEAGESPMDAAKREVLEETGAHLGPLSLVGLYYGMADELLRIAFAAPAVVPTRPSLDTIRSEGVESGPSIATPLEREFPAPPTSNSPPAVASIPLRWTEGHYADEILECAWFDPEDLPNPIPVLARRIITAALSRTQELATIVDDAQLE